MCDDAVEHRRGAQMHPGGDRCDLEFCQNCTHAFTTALEGFWVGPDDIGEEAEGGTAEVFREDAQNFGEWQGFEEEDVGPWCQSCSWKLQRKRTKQGVTA